MLSYIHPMTYLQGLVRRVETDLIILSPFATLAAAEALLGGLTQGARLTMVVRWSKLDITLGSSDLAVAGLVWSKNGRLLRHPLLHGKLFMFDKYNYVFGSANVTSRGLAHGSVAPNIECMSAAYTVEPIDLTFVNSTIREAQFVDEVLLKELQRQVEENADKSEFDENRIASVSNRLAGLFISDFPYSTSAEAVLAHPNSAESRHDLAMLSLTVDDLSVQVIRDRFRSSVIIKWVREQCVSPISFGEMSHRMHNAMLDDPKPYRRDVKAVQANMYRWIKELLSDEFRIWIPEGAHSELIQRSA